MARTGRSRRPVSEGRDRDGAAVFVIALVSTIATCPTNASGSWRPSGAVTAGPVVRHGEVGGHTLVDIWKPFGIFRLGGNFGVAVFPSDNAERSRVFMPLGLSAAVILETSSIGFDLRARAGGWAGATNEGLAGGGWLAVGGHVEYALDPKVAVSAGVDGWFLFDDDSPRYIVPGVGLVWTLPGE